MFIQIKAIRKGCKPPRWRRAYVPLHITFSQMAYILEVLLELPQTDRFEFEFYQEKDRLIERQKDEPLPQSYEYSYWSAKDSCVDDWLMTKTWFTFRLKEQTKHQPEYRVESEKLFDTIRFSTGNQGELSYPVILKEVSVKEDECWSDGKKINQILKETCFLKVDKLTYPSFSKVQIRIQKQQGIETSPKLKSRDHLICRSTQSVIAEAADSLKQYVLKKQNMAAAAKKSSPSGLVRKNTATMLEMLNSYTKADLADAAEETGCTLNASTKPKMAFELARHLLEPEVMRGLFLSLTERELDAFESAIDKKRFQPTDEEWEELAGAYDLNYIAEYTDGTAEVPSDAALIYKLISKNGYRTYHADARWLIECLTAFELLYVVGPVKLLFRMYKQREGSLTDYMEFQDRLKKIPSEWNPCRLIGSKLVSYGVVKDNIYMAVEQRQRDVPYYLPNEEEIREYASYGYPASENAYTKLHSFFRKELKFENVVCEELCRHAFSFFSASGMLSDYMDEIRERNIIFSTERQLETFVKIVTELNNHTRMFELKGHTPKEMMQLMPVSISGGRPTILPMTSLSAEMLKKSQRELSSMGIEIDTDSTADSVLTMALPDGSSGKMKAGIKKIYPNDPCPCGSGKKYKKCCGRK